MALRYHIFWDMLFFAYFFKTFQKKMFEGDLKNKEKVSHNIMMQHDFLSEDHRNFCDSLVFCIAKSHAEAGELTSLLVAWKESG